MDLEETLVAHALATSSIRVSMMMYFHGYLCATRGVHTGTVVVCIEQGKERADDEDVGVFGEHHLASGDQRWSVDRRDGVCSASMAC